MGRVVLQTPGGDVLAFFAAPKNKSHNQKENRRHGGRTPAFSLALYCYSSSVGNRVFLC